MEKAPLKERMFTKDIFGTAKREETSEEMNEAKNDSGSFQKHTMNLIFPPCNFKGGGNPLWNEIKDDIKEAAPVVKDFITDTAPTVKSVLGVIGSALGIITKIKNL